MKNIGIIGSADGPTAIYVSKDDPNFLKSGGIVEDEDVVTNENVADEENITTEEVIVNNDINEILNSRTMAENLESGVKIMGLGMVAVFGVLTILYVVIKIMGYFAKGKKDNEKN